MADMGWTLGADGGALLAGTGIAVLMRQQKQQTGETHVIDMASLKQKMAEA